MPHIPETTDEKEWHRYFSMESNNRAWELAVESRSSSEDLEMLNAAHAAAFHWSVVGEQIHKMRATLLLAEVHALLGFGDSALVLATETRDYFLVQETPDWEIAFAHTIHAHAAWSSDNIEIFQLSYKEAQRAIDNISDDEDRAVVLKTFSQISTP
ncbi:MAG: hypothetical protein ACI9UU_001041 [Candidatus Azotimanducaceae bacterium]|jgi:hypothetical protein